MSNVNLKQIQLKIAFKIILDPKLLALNIQQPELTRRDQLLLFRANLSTQGKQSLSNLLLIYLMTIFSPLLFV